MFKIPLPLNDVIKSPANVITLSYNQLPILTKIKTNNVIETPIIAINPITENVIISSNIFTPTSITFPTPNYIIEVKSIQIAGFLYRESTTANVPGTYTIDLITEIITLTTNQLISSGQVAVIYGYSARFTTNQIALPGFVNELSGYGITGTININQSFEQHPNASFNLVADKYGVSVIRSVFRNYATKYNFYNIPFRVSSINVSTKPVEEYPDGLFDISVQLEGWFSYLYNLPITYYPLSSIANYDKFASPQCQLGKPDINLGYVAQDKYNKDNYVIGLDELATRANIDYRGYNFNITFPKTTPRDAITTFNNVLSSELLHSQNLYVDYNSNSVTTKKWNNYTSYGLSENSIYSVSESYRNTPIEYRTVKLDVPDILIDDEKTSETHKNDEINKIKQKPIFEYKKTKIIRIPTGDPTASSPPAGTGVVKTIDSNFDVSGTRKEYGWKDMEGDSIIKEYHAVYGFAFIGRSLFNSDGILVGKDISSDWQIIEEQTIDYIYDDGFGGNTGYLLGTNTSGFKLQRYQIETNELNSYNKIRNVQDLPDLVPYQFVRVPITGRTRYLLEQYSNYYKDANDVPLIEYQECDIFGNLITKFIEDPNYIKEMFVVEEQSEYVCFSMIDNPVNRKLTKEDLANGAPVAAPLTTGEEKYSSSKIKIFKSDNTKHGFINLFQSYIGDSLQPSKEDKYIKYTSVQNAQDASFVNSKQDVNEEIVTGKPPAGIRKSGNYIQTNVVDPKTGKFIDKDKLAEESKLIETNKNTVKTPTVQEYIYILTTPPFTAYTPITNTITYSTDVIIKAINNTDQTSIINKALEIAKYELELQDFQNSESTNVNTFFNPNIKPGDAVGFNWSFSNYNNRVLSNSSTITIVDTNTVVGETQLTLGKDSNIGNTVTMTKLLNPEYKAQQQQLDAENNNNSAFSNGRFAIYETNKSIGSLSGMGIKTRRNPY